MQRSRQYIAIDLKTFYASVECVERNMNPLDTNLVVADASRTEKTICLAVSPSLKAYGISGRARLFEVVSKVNEINAMRRTQVYGHKLKGSSCFASELKSNKELELSYIIATPRMSLYMKYSTYIYNIYLKYVAAEDIHVYSVDEVFIDIGAYLGIYNVSPRELAMKMIKDIYDETGITATAGIGTNLYLCKIAMDIVAKHMPADKYGVRIAELDEHSYREQSGVLVQDMKKSCMSMACIQWVMLQDVLLDLIVIFIMRNFYISFLVLMQNCLSTMHGGMNLVQ